MRRRSIIVATSLTIVAVVIIVTYPYAPGSIERNFSLTAFDFGYNTSHGGPDIRVRAGEVVALTLANRGSFEHELIVVSEEVLKRAMVTEEHPDPVFTKAVIHNVGPGETKSTRFVADRPGVYFYACFIKKPDLHIRHGMFAKFIVEG